MYNPRKPPDSKNNNSKIAAATGESTFALASRKTAAIEHMVYTASVDKYWKFFSETLNRIIVMIIRKMPDMIHNRMKSATMPI